MSRAGDQLAALGLSGRIAGLRAALICASLAALAAILLLAVSGWFLTGAALAGAAGGAAVLAFNFLLPSAAIRALAIIRTVARYGERLLSHSAALRRMADIRATLFAALAAQDGRDALDLSGGDATAQLIGEIVQLENAVVRRPARAASAIAACGAVALVLLAGWRAALALGVLLAVLPSVLQWLSDVLTKIPAVALAEASATLRTRFVESAAARAEIITYGIINRVVADLGAIAAEVDRARAALFRAEAAVAALLIAYGAGVASVVLIASRGPAPIRAFALLAAIGSVEAMTGFARDALSRRSIAASLARLSALVALDGAPPPRPGTAVAGLSLTLGTVEISAGSRIAITGASGSGKTRLIEALAGLRRAPFPIALGGTPLSHCAAATIRDQTALSPQDATLIAGTIGDNLRVARAGLSEAELWAALDTACLAERVRAMPDGLATLLGEAGGILSGGERKRLSLARALLAGRPWLLLDEPTEGLDAMIERALVDHLAIWLDRTGAGLILASHRPAPLVLTDRQLPVTALHL